MAFRITLHLDWLWTTPSDVSYPDLVRIEPNPILLVRCWRAELTSVLLSSWHCLGDGGCSLIWGSATCLRRRSNRILGEGGLVQVLKCKVWKKWKVECFLQKLGWHSFMSSKSTDCVVAFCFSVCFHFHFGLSVDILHRLYKCGGWTDHYTIYTWNHHYNVWLVPSLSSSSLGSYPSTGLNVSARAVRPRVQMMKLTWILIWTNDVQIKEGLQSLNPW